MYLFLMDFFLSILMMLAVILPGIFWKEIVDWIIPKKHKTKDGRGK
jgi:hypothetical protein